MGVTIYRLVMQIINVVFGIIAIFLGLRILLRLLSANTATPFVSWVYAISDTFMAPFAGIFPTADIGGNAVLDLSAIITLIIYAVLSYIITALLHALIRPTEPYTTVEHTHAV